MSFPSAPAGAPPAPRPPLLRARRERVLGGVCRGLAVHLGVPLNAVRLIFLVSGFFGVGLVVYGFFWLTMPEGDALAAGPVRSHLSRPVLVGLGVVLVAAMASGVSVGVNIAPRALLPGIAVVAGLMVAWSIVDRSRRQQWLVNGDFSRREPLLRMGIGAVLVLGGLTLVASQGRGLGGLRDLLVATLVVVVGIVLLAAPFVIRLWDDVRQEQTERIRATEKADIAAHLHDSVLQTLALIQRRSDDPTAVQRLARAQERELRQWLFADGAPSTATIASAVTAAAHEIEDLHGVPIDLVVTGDGALDEDGVALVQALREALANAVRHASPPVSAYVEVGAREVEAFVRDHGAGFDPDSVSEDRLGMRESIVGRMSRHGGSATVRRREDGTEVSLRLPLPAPEEAEL